MKTYYIVQEKGFEYNDETYDMQEGGTPVKVFDNEEDAKDAADKLNFKKLSSEPIFQFSYEKEDIINDMDEFLEKLKEITGESITEEELEYDWSLPKMTYKQYLTLKGNIELSFYEVVECDGKE